MYLIVLLCACVLARAQESSTVNTTQGLVVGNLVNNKYFAFFGIPYAGPASGENRFKAPTPAPNFPGEFHAVISDVLCAQPSFRGIIGKEDCLVLNVYTKNVTTPKPVIVWINGENFATDLKHVAFDTLVQSDLVVVSINYRLSIFGFLCLGVADAPGNAGLKDIVQGLRWVQANIAAFGGDPNNVILMGHGSGAAMVDLITLSPLATGLMHKAIALSGSGLAPWAVSYDPVNQASAVGDRLGYAGKDRQELARLLSTTDINVLGNTLAGSWSPNNTVMFAPCIENSELDPNDTFLSEVPIEILRSGNYSDIPYIGGNTNREGTIKAEYAAFNQWLEKMEANFTEFIQVDISFPSESNQTALVNELRQFYFSQRQINMETIEDYLDYQGDTTILVSVTRNVRERALTSRSEVRLFEFAFRGTDNSDWPLPQIPLSGVRHGRLLNYLFDFGLTPNDVIVRDTLINRVTAFAYTGNPNPVNGSFTTWLAMEHTVPHVLLISGEEVNINQTIFKEELRINLNQQEMEFWNRMYSEFYVPPKPVSSASKQLYFTYILPMFLITQLILRFI